MQRICACMSASGHPEWHFRRRPPASIESREECRRKVKEKGRDDLSIYLWSCSERRDITVKGWGLMRRSQVGVEKWREKGSRRRGERRWSWCEDENWFIAALMRRGMPGDSGCSPSPCCGNIKRNRGPPSCYNCCGDLSKGSRSLCRNLCNPDCWYPARYFQYPCRMPQVGI